jgi:hypothetical protein
MRRRGTLLVTVVAALLAVNGALLVLEPGLALPTALGDRFLGPTMVRAEVVVQDATGLHDYRLDQGRIQAVRRGAITLLERDGTVVSVPVAPGVRVQLNGTPVALGELRRGMRAMTVRDGERPAEQIIAFARRR